MRTDARLHMFLVVYHSKDLLTLRNKLAASLWEPDSEGVLIQQKYYVRLCSIFFKDRSHIKINRFFRLEPFDVRAAGADQIHTGPNLSAYTVCLSTPPNRPYSPVMAVPRQKGRQTEGLTVPYLVPTLPSVCRVFISLAGGMFV